MIDTSSTCIRTRKILDLLRNLLRILVTRKYQEFNSFRWRPYCEYIVIFHKNTYTNAAGDGRRQRKLHLRLEHPSHPQNESHRRELRYRRSNGRERSNRLRVLQESTKYNEAAQKYDCNVCSDDLLTLYNSTRTACRALSVVLHFSGCWHQLINRVVAVLSCRVRVCVFRNSGCW